MTFAPYRPRALGVANALGRALGGVGLRRPLDAQALIARARKKAGLVDFGPPEVEGPLTRMVEAIEAEADLHPVGRFITRERLTGVLVNRLRIEDLLKRTPGAREATLAPLVVITGLQRTGTTLLQRLLSSDPRCRPLYSYEAVAPAPVPGAPAGAMDPRRKQARTAERALRYMSPDFFAIHPVEAEGTEEDSILLDLSLYSPVAEATLRVPSYSTWLAEQDMRPAYRYLATVLRALEVQRRGEWWVLKTPAHLPFLDVLLEVFGGTTVVHTHRDPQRTVASYCSMIANGRGIFSDAVDAAALGQEMLQTQARMVHAAMAARARPEVHARVIDVYYPDLIEDPMAAVARVYEQMGRPLEPARGAMQDTLQNHGQHRFGRHEYRLEDFGLGAEDVQRTFAPYLARHGERLS